MTGELLPQFVFDNEHIQGMLKNVQSAVLAASVGAISPRDVVYEALELASVAVRETLKNPNHRDVKEWLKTGHNIESHEDEDEDE